ncbi:MAG TPA: hypothetical protein VJN69_14445 [Candidatus Acidoferrales bacterium]|nr:hypothetical protein [Candidatus Acidoferrales bacterium]
MAELDRPKNFSGIDDEFGDVPSAAETRQQADEAFRNGTDTRARADGADADTQSLEDAINSGNADDLRAMSERQLSPDAERMFDNLAQSKFGVSAQELRTQFAKAIHVEQSAREMAEASIFMQNHPEYTATPTNSDRLLGFIQSKHLPLTADSLDYAYFELTRQGALEGIGAGQTRQTPHVGLSDYQGARQNYGEGNETKFDAEAFRTLSASARRQYVSAVEYAEKNGHKVPTIAEFKRSYRASPAD